MLRGEARRAALKERTDKMKNTVRGFLVGVMALLSLMGNAYGWSREEEKKLEGLFQVLEQEEH